MDVIYTQNIMGIGGVETNPFALWLINSFGFNGLLVWKTGWIGVLFIFSRFMDTCPLWLKIFFWIAITNYFVASLYHLILKMITT